MVYAILGQPFGDKFNYKGCILHQLLIFLHEGNFYRNRERCYFRKMENKTNIKKMLTSRENSKTNITEHNKNMALKY